MIDPKNRRQFLKTAAAGGVAWTAADWTFLGTLPRVSAADVTAVSDRVQFTPEIEPLVRLIEDTPREQVLEKLASVIRKGTPYRDVLAALQLTGIRNVQPRPVGFKFHSVLVVNSCHLASASGPDDERWLPIFWAVDYVKSTQAEERQKTGWNMKPVNEAKVPKGPEAAKVFAEAMRAIAEEGRSVRALRPLRRSRLPRYRPQGDLPRQRLADSGSHWLAACRADSQVAGLRHDVPRERAGPRKE
jgi:hypothetical protein